MANYISFKDSTISRVINMDILGTLFCDSVNKSITITLTTGEVFNLPLNPTSESNDNRYTRIAKVMVMEDNNKIYNIDNYIS